MILEIPYKYVSPAITSVDIEAVLFRNAEIKRMTSDADFAFVRWSPNVVYVVKYRYGVSGWKSQEAVNRIISDRHDLSEYMIFGRSVLLTSIFIINNNKPSDFKPLIMVL